MRHESTDVEASRSTPQTINLRWFLRRFTSTSLRHPKVASSGTATFFT